MRMTIRVPRGLGIGLAIGVSATILLPARGVILRGPAAMQGASAADALPSVDQVLDKYIQALGGRSAIEKLTTRVMKGTIELPSTGETGTMQIYKKAPDKGLFAMFIPSNGATPRGFNGKAGWYFDPDEGLKDAASTDLPAIKRESVFNREIKLKTLYPQMTLSGKEREGGRDAYVIQATADDGTVEKMFFDAQTGLLVRFDTPYVTEDGKSFLQTVFEDYRAVDGVKVPFVWRQTSPDFDYVIKFESIQNNVAIDDSKFEKPAQ